MPMVYIHGHTTSIPPMRIHAPKSDGGQQTGRATSTTMTRDLAKYGRKCERILHKRKCDTTASKGDGCANSDCSGFTPPSRWGESSLVCLYVYGRHRMVTNPFDRRRSISGLQALS
ncbi:hypothetical protein BGZ61DRAFT_16362 [Ilyonectria robusta]|uniref:uncharacterized protein n=1 Tax=Ilyonectria robusta TaxID=1079257 RepID=UPI001E8DBB73|nr:uncharacterized protein BGZ61DRAFT_16362 [Ilyonectria robusta]KAH8737464.1 hypothetical protein BGZ61DRAFT_16362 [Ilyonectria robusta]